MRTQQTQSSGDSVQAKYTLHQPVLLQEVIYWLNVKKSDTVFDGTLGGGGHALALVNLLGGSGTFVGTDVDAVAIQRAEDVLSKSGAKIILAHTNFKNIKEVCEQNDIPRVNKVLLDLGWSSDQMDVPGKGLSFMRDEPLDMRLDNSLRLTAKEIVNEWEEENIADVIYGWGGERYSRRIAKAIVEARKRKPVETTSELVQIISAAVPASYRLGRIHPATRTFQALRIAVNDEIRILEQALESIREVLAHRGRVAVISFHSSEDRVVKHAFRNWAQDELGSVLTKKPIIADESEVKENPRARSAKLRVFEKYENTN